MGLFDDSPTAKLNSIFDDPKIGTTKFWDWNHIDRYLVIPKTAELNVGNVVQRKGGTKYLVDQLLNPESIELKLGGIYDDVEGVLVAGRIGTVSNHSFSLDLYGFIQKNIRKEFKRIGTFYVGADAEKKLDIGWRLVTMINSPKEYDLVKWVT